MNSIDIFVFCMQIASIWDSSQLSYDEKKAEKILKTN